MSPGKEDVIKEILMTSQMGDEVDTPALPKRQEETILRISEFISAKMTVGD